MHVCINWCPVMHVCIIKLSYLFSTFTIMGVCHCPNKGWLIAIWRPEQISIKLDQILIIFFNKSSLWLGSHCTSIFSVLTYANIDRLIWKIQHQDVTACQYAVQNECQQRSVYTTHSCVFWEIIISSNVFFHYTLINENANYKKVRSSELSYSKVLSNMYFTAQLFEYIHSAHAPSDKFMLYLLPAKHYLTSL